MNSLENLNNFSNDPVSYPGDAAYSIAFSPANAVNQTTSTVEDQPFTAPPGTNLDTMVSTPGDIVYTVDLSTATYPATVDWGTLPYFATSVYAGTNIFQVVGTIDPDLWQQIRSPTITIPDQSANFTYTSNIAYPDPANVANTAVKSWSTTVTVTASPDISTPTPAVYVKNSTGTIGGTPTILDTNSGTYTLTITPSSTAYVYLISSSGTGGTSTFNSVTKVLTISGTKAQVNSHLTAISFTPVANTGQPLTLSYGLTNPSGKLSVVTQPLTSTAAYSIGIATYVEDTPFSLGYQILDTSTTATTFTISVAQTTPLPAVSAGYFTVNGSNVGNTWSTSGTKATINAANVVYTPPIDYTDTITLTVNQSKIDNGATVVQVTNEPNNIENAGTNTEIVNMIARSYTSNNTNSIFSTTTPAITDGPDIGQTYTITLASSLGKFGNSAANAVAAASYTFTGNKTACNAQFALMKFVPNFNTSASGTFTYTQTRASTVQVNTTLALTGSLGPALTPFYQVYTGNATFTPTFNQIWYGNTIITAVAGGGAGGAWNPSPISPAYRPAGGGGGGEVLEITRNATVARLTGNITITPGAGGNVTGGTGYTGSNTVVSDSSYTHTSRGGLGGVTSLSQTIGGKGGDSGNGNAGAQPIAGGTGVGGGGGGAGGAANAVPYYDKWIPGPGKQVVINTGNTAVWCGGGGCGGGLYGANAFSGNRVQVQSYGGGGWGGEISGLASSALLPQKGQNGAVIIKIT